jgi:LuxR family glucitol operon transcriptional activator
MVVGLLKYERRPLQQIVDDLYAARGDLFDDLFSRAWALLDEAGRRILMVMTFFPDSASGEALSATADVTGFDFDRAAERLTDLSLLDVQQADLVSTPRYLLHPLVWSFASARLAEQPEFEQAAQERWVIYHYALALQYGADGWDLPYQIDRAERDMTTFQEVMLTCYQQKDWQKLAEMVLAVRTFWNIRGYFEKRDAFVDMGLHAARELEDKPKQVQLLAIRVRTLCYLGIIGEAQQCQNQARAILDTIDDPDPTLMEILNEAEIRIGFRLGDLSRHLNLAKANVASANRRGSEGRKVLYSYYIADYLYHTGQYEQAETMYTNLIVVSEGIGYQRVLISGWGTLAQIALHQGQLELADQRLQKARTLAQGIKHYRQLAEVNWTQARIYQAQGNVASAVDAMTEAIDLFERMGMRHELAEARDELARLEAQMAEAAE